MTDCIIRSRIDPNIKTEASALFKNMGLTLSEAVRLFLYQSVAEKRIPFSINIPNAQTRLTLKQANEGKNLEKTSISELKKNWEAECAK